MSSGDGAAGRVSDLDLNCETVPILDSCEAGVEDDLVGTGSLVLERERGETSDGGGDEKKECESEVPGWEDGMVGNGKGSGGSDLGGESEVSAVGTVTREAVAESHVGKLLEVDLGEKGSIELAVLSTAGLEAVAASRQITDFGDESACDQERGTDVDTDGLAGTDDNSLSVLSVGQGAVSEMLEGSSILRKEQILVQIGLVDGGEQVVEGKLGLEELESEVVSHHVKLLDVVTVERESTDLVAVSAEEFEDVEAGYKSMVSKNGSGSDQKPEMGINADGMVKGEQLGPREIEAEIKSYDAKFLEIDKEEEGNPGLVAVSTEGFDPVEESNNSVNSHDDSCGDQKRGTDFDAEGTVIDDEFDSQKLKAEVVSLDRKLSELKRGEKGSTDVVAATDKGSGPVNAKRQPMDLADGSDAVQMLETGLDAKAMVEANDDSVSVSVSVSDSYGGNLLELNEGKGSEELVAVSTKRFGPVKASNEAIDLEDGSCDVQILGTDVDAKRLNEAFVSLSGDTCRKLLDSNKEEKGSTELFDISTEIFEPVKASSQSIDLADGSGDVQTAAIDVDAKSGIIISEDAVSSSLGVGVKLLELYSEEKGIADLVSISTKMLEPVTSSSPAIDLADGSGDIQMLETDVDAKGIVRTCEGSVCISPTTGRKLLHLDEEEGNSELVPISSEVFESVKDSSQGIDLRDRPGDHERQGTDLEAEVMDGINEGSISISFSSGGKILELEREEKESTELVGISTEVFEHVKTSSQSIDLGDGASSDQRLGTDVEAAVIIRNNEDYVTFSTVGGGLKDEGLAIPLFMRKEQDEVRGDSEDRRLQVLDDNLGTGNREFEVKSYGEGFLEVDMMEKGRTEAVSASTKQCEASDAKVVDLGDGSADDHEHGSDVDKMGGNDDSIVCGGPEGERLGGSLILRGEKYDLVDGCSQFLDDQSRPGEREAEVESRRGMLFKVDMGDKEKSDLIAVASEDFEAIEANNQIRNLKNDSFGGRKQGINVDGEGIVLDGQISPGGGDTELKSHSRKYLEVNKKMKGSAEMVTSSNEVLEPVVASNYSIYFGDGSDDDEEGADLAADAMAVEGELGKEAEFQSHERNTLEFDREEKGSAELFYVSSEVHQNVKDTTEAMEMGYGSVGDHRFVSKLDAETTFTTDEESIVLSVASGVPGDERLEESLALKKEQIPVQDDLVNGSGLVVPGELSIGKWKNEVISYVERPVEMDIGEREGSKLVSASTEVSEVVESSNQVIDLGEGSNSERKQKIDDAGGVVGNEVYVAVSVAVEATGDERLVASLDFGKEQVEIPEYLVDGCCHVVDGEKVFGERGNKLESHDGGLLEVVLGEKRMELTAIPDERFGTIEHQAMGLGDKSDVYQTQGIDGNAEGMVRNTDDSTISPGIGVFEHEGLEESSVLGIDHVKVLEKSVDGCGQVSESELIHEKGSLVVKAYDDELLKVETEEKGDAELFAVLAGRSETAEACTQSMDLKDGPDGDQKQEIGVDADCMVGTNEDSLNVSAAGCSHKDESLEKEHIEIQEDIVYNCDQALDDVLDRQKREAEVELDTGEIGNAELASASTGVFCSVGATSQDKDFEDGQNEGSDISYKSRDRTDKDPVAIAVVGTRLEDEILDLSSNLVKEEGEVCKGTKKIRAAGEDFFGQFMKSEVIGVDKILTAHTQTEDDGEIIGVDKMILNAHAQTEDDTDHVPGFKGEATNGRNESSTCTFSAGDGVSEDGKLENSFMFVKNQDPIPISKELGSGSHEMDGNMEIAVVSGYTIGSCDVAKTESLDAVANVAELSACRHTIENNTLEKGAIVLERNGLVTIITPAGEQNATAQQNFDNQGQVEDSSSMMVSFRGEEAHAANVSEYSNSVFGINRSDASAELDNLTIFPQSNEPSVGCQDVQPPDVSSVENDKLEPENGVDEATNCCQSFQDAKSEHLKESHNQSEVCNDASTESSSTSQQATYNLSFPEKESFSTSDLVWGKVKSHPWWPGQVFDFTGASKLALKYQKKDHFLVAYFGDKTFAWCEESRLKPFQPYFSQMEKQTNSDSFLRALHDMLVEVARRVELSMTCLCLPEETYADIEYQKVENAGVRGKTVNSVIDRHEIVNCFHPDKFLDYVRDLSQFPNGGADRLELTIAQAQLKAFYLFKGYTELPSFTNGSGLVENDFEIPTCINRSMKEEELDHSATLKDLFSTKGKLRVRDGTLGKQKHIVEDGRKQKNMSELMEEGTTFIIVNGNENAPSVHDVERCLSSGNKRKAAGYFSDDIERIKGKKINSLANKETKLPSPTFSSSFKVGEFISRAASKLACGQPLRKCYAEKSDDWTIDYLDIDDVLDFPFDNPKIQIDISEEYPPANEMLSKLCLAARNPLKGYNFSSIVISFFTAFRNLQVSNISIEMNKTEKPRAKRGRKKKVIPILELPDTSTPDYMKDSYWSDMIVPEKDAILNPPKRRGRKKRKFYGESPPPQMLTSPSDEPKLHAGSMCPHVKHVCIAERPIITVEEKIVDERAPTAVILYFNCSDSLPSDVDLIRIFSRYGPLKEEETSIETKTNSAMVVFKKRADAEMAFSSAWKFSTFGPALISYRLRHFPAKSSPANTLNVEDHSTLIMDRKIGILAEPESESASDGNLCEKIPPVRLECVDRGPSYFSQTQEDDCSTHVQTGSAGEFSDPSTETGIVSENLRFECFGQEFSYFDLDMAECGDVSGNTQVETSHPARSGVTLELSGTEARGENSSALLPNNAELLEVSHAESPVQVVTSRSDSLGGQLEDRTALSNASQLEAIDQGLYTSSSRAEVKTVQDEFAISPVQPGENACPDSSPAHVDNGTSDQSSLAISSMEIPAVSEEPSNSVATQATAISDSTYVGGKIKESTESNVAEADAGIV